jgi:PAS domain S-box-containing protein
MNGVEVCRRIRSNSATARIPVLMLSATHILDQDRVRGLEGGADAYMTGPPEPDVLIATVNAMIRAHTAEDALQRSLSQWQVTVNAISDGVVLLDREGSIVQCNAAIERLFDRRETDLVGFNCATLLGDEIYRAIRGESQGAMNVDNVDVPIGDRWFHLSSNPVVGPNGEFDGTVCTISDITERKHAEQELKEAKDVAEAADRAKDQFLAVLSHELRTPLTPVMTAVQAIQEERSLPPDVRTYLEVIKRNVELEARLIDDLLDLTRIARNKLQLDLEIADAHGLIGYVIRMCEDDIRAKGLQLKLDLAADPHHIMADPARAQQVLWNLIKNAVKFTYPGGTITIATRTSGARKMRIEITDTGIGIDPEILPRIFNAFEQGEQSITRQFGGLGLGLAISKALVEMQGGVLTAMSDGRDRGATFAIELPSALRSEAEGTDPDLRTEPEPERVMPRILIVDDHADTSRVMQLLLERRGYHVNTAQTMQGALNEACRGTYDLLISDIGLPDGSGLELMRELVKHKQIHAIALSGFGMEEDIQNSIDAGFAEHLTKPVSFKRLHEVIQRLLG